MGNKKLTVIIVVSIVVLVLMTFIQSNAASSDSIKSTGIIKVGDTVIFDYRDLISAREKVDDIEDRMSDGDIKFRFGKDESGRYGYYKDGESTITPF